MAGLCLPFSLSFSQINLFIKVALGDLDSSSGPKSCPLCPFHTDFCPFHADFCSQKAALREAC